MIRLPRKRPEIPKRKSIWPADAVFEYDRFGAKIHLNSKNRTMWVKDVYGKIIRKSQATPLVHRPTPKPIPYLPDKYNKFEFIYIDLESNIEDIKKINMEDLIASRWDEDFK